tara:strand:- start:6867 stop:7025 length:159 start_codon:yes stop_codon:yes gene_type:complete
MIRRRHASGADTATAALERVKNEAGVRDFAEDEGLWRQSCDRRNFRAMSAEW